MAVKSADFGVSAPNTEGPSLVRRLLDAIEHSGKKRRDVAKEADIHFKTLENYLSGTDIQTETVAALAKATGVSVSWLGFGLGDMLDTQEFSIQAAAPSLSDFVMLPHFDARAAAGDGEETFSDGTRGHLAFSRNWLSQHVGRKEENLALIEAVGDSMSPTINDGDTLLIDISVHEARADSIYIISTVSGLIVKRIQISPVNGLHIISDNPAFRSETLRTSDRHEMRIVAEVVGHGRFGR